MLTVGAHALEIEAFVMRAAEENREQVYAWLLQRNARMYAVSWAIDGTGDVYLTGRVALASVTADEIDRILGCVLEYADGSFNVLLEMGFALVHPARMGLAGEERPAAGQPGRVRALRAERNPTRFTTRLRVEIGCGSLDNATQS